MPRPGLTPYPLLVACLLAACSDGSRTTGEIVTPLDQPRIASTRVSGAADGLAAELLLSTSTSVPWQGQPPFLMTAPGLADELRFHTFGHLETVALGSGAGAILEGSQRVRRLALVDGAPMDGNGNGTNLDETLSLELQRLAAAVGTSPPAGSAQMLFPWRDASAELVGVPVSRASYRAQRTAPVAPGVVDLGDVGAALRARVLAAGALLLQSRGSLPGASAREGMLGVQFLQQALAIEETLLGALFFDGRVTGELREPKTYDPVAGRRWLPRAFRVLDQPGLPGAPGGYAVSDGASSLSDLAALLHGAVELGWLAADDNSHPTLRDLFDGLPFGDPGAPSRPRPLGGSDEPTLSFAGDIGPLMTFRCGGCHGFQPGQGGFSVLSYESVLAGSTRSQQMNVPLVVPGDHQQSLLWQILTTPPPWVANRMPLGLPMPQGEISLIADWIDQGALRDPVELPPPPQPGLDLAAVLFRNLAAMHFDARSGALHNRHEGDAPSGWATAEATGAALTALASLAALFPDLRQGDLTVRELLVRARVFAGRHLVDGEGFALQWCDAAGGQPGPRADLGGHAALTAGLLAAERAVPLPNELSAERSGRILARTLLEQFADPVSRLFDVRPGFATRRYDPATLVPLLASLREASAAGIEEAGPAHDEVLGLLRSVLVHAEWDDRGEVLGDGIADTDGNGIPEPTLAGGPLGRAPVFVGEILAGPEGVEPPPDDRISWSRHIKPLLRLKCAECHLNGNTLGDYRLDTPTLLEQPGESGGAMPLLVPGDPQASLVYRKVADRLPPVGVQMPQARPPLDERAVEIVRQWILQGATRR